MQNLTPEHPADAGIETHLPDLSHIEGSELLANESRHLLRKRGFSDQEIEEWAHTYIADQHTGDVASFVAWIDARERVQGEAGER